MAKKSKRSRREFTEEERAAWEAKQRRLREIAYSVSKMTEEEAAALIARIGGRIPKCDGELLSIKNSALLMQQLETVKMVGGLRQWNAVGRKIIKDQKALYIRKPNVANSEELKAGTADEAELRFDFVPVYDVSQTEPIPEKGAGEAAGGSEEAMDVAGESTAMAAAA